MTYDEFRELKIGDRICNIKRKHFKIICIRNKDKFIYGKNGFFIGFIHKNNYSEFTIENS